MKDLTEENQFRLINLVNKNLIKEAYELECELNKQFYISEGVDRLNNALTTGMLCYREKYNTPNWIKNNKYLEQCFASGYSNEAKKNKI